MFTFLEITKVMTKLSKEAGCEGVTDWIKPSGNHSYWSACFTHDGNGKFIWAKFRSFLSHIVNKHDSLDDPLFSKCDHGPDISPREYLFEGMFQSILLPCVNLPFSNLHK